MCGILWLPGEKRKKKNRLWEKKVCAFHVVHGVDYWNEDDLQPK